MEDIRVAVRSIRVKPIDEEGPCAICGQPTSLVTANTTRVIYVCRECVTNAKSRVYEKAMTSAGEDSHVG